MIHGLITALLLIAFLGGCLWLFGHRQQAELDAAARLPLEDDADQPPGPQP